MLLTDSDRYMCIITRSRIPPCVSGICDDWAKLKSNKYIVTSVISSGKGGRGRIPIYIWEVKITKEYRFIVTHTEIETEVNIFWYVWGRD